MVEGGVTWLPERDSGPRPAPDDPSGGLERRTFAHEVRMMALLEALLTSVYCSSGCTVDEGRVRATGVGANMTPR